MESQHTGKWNVHTKWIKNTTVYLQWKFNIKIKEYIISLFNLITLYISCFVKTFKYSFSSYENKYINKK
jgi:hypothetical protein